MNAGEVETRGSRVLVGIVLVGGTLVLLSGPTWAFWVGAAGVTLAWLVTGVAWALSANRADHVRISKRVGSAFVAEALRLVWFWCVFDVLTGRWWAATALALAVVGLILLGRRELRRARVAADISVASRQPTPRTVPKLRRVKANY